MVDCRLAGLVVGARFAEVYNFGVWECQGNGCGENETPSSTVGEAQQIAGPEPHRDLWLVGALYSMGQYSVLPHDCCEPETTTKELYL